MLRHLTTNTYFIEIRHAALSSLVAVNVSAANTTQRDFFFRPSLCTFRCIRANLTLRFEIIVIWYTVGGGMTRKLAGAMSLSHYSSSARAAKEIASTWTLQKNAVSKKRGFVCSRSASRSKEFLVNGVTVKLHCVEVVLKEFF